MELKLAINKEQILGVGLLIAPYGIETLLVQFFLLLVCLF